MQRTDQPKAAYRSDDRELLLGFYKWLLWRWMIPLIPRWITPNAITIFGAVCSVLAVITAVLAALAIPLALAVGVTGPVIVLALCPLLLLWYGLGRRVLAGASPL